MRKSFKKMGAVLVAVAVTASTVTLPENTVTANAASKVKITNVSTSTLTITKGSSKQLKAKAGGKKITWASSNKKVVSVSKKGKIKGLKKGKATITAKAKNRKKATIKVIVGTKVSKVSLLRKVYVTYVGGKTSIRPTVSPSKASNKKLVYTSSNKKVATVNSKGVISGIKTGTAKITAKATDGSGKSVTATIKVLKSESVVTAVDDFYQSVNNDTIAGATMNAETQMWSEFDELQEAVDQRVDGIVKDNGSYDKGSSQANVQALYATGSDMATRDNNGASELKEVFDKIEACTTIDEFLKAQGEMSLAGYDTIIPLNVNVDLADLKKYRLHLNMPETVLPKAAFTNSYYSSYLSTYRSFMEKMLQESGESSADAATNASSVINLQNAVAVDLDSLLNISSSMSMDDLEKYLLERFYKSYTQDQLKSAFPNCDITTFLNAAGYGAVDEIVVELPDSVTALGGIMVENNLSGLKEWAKFAVMYQYAPYLSSVIYDAYAKFGQEFTGVEAQSAQDFMLDKTENILQWDISKVYTDKYVTPADKSAVTDMANKIKTQYYTEITNCSWMSETTKANAKQKLDTMTVNVLYPDNYDVYLLESDLTSTAENGTLVGNLKMIFQETEQSQQKALGSSLSGGDWIESPLTVNAWYYAYNNSITIASGIVGDVTYNSNRSEAANLGGLGAIVGHEISHAFDDQGSQYDQNGDKNNWWTVEDTAKFQQLQNKLVAYYDTFELIDGKREFQNGKQTLSENIADLAGVSCVIQCVDNNIEARKEFFTAYGKMWACKMSDYTIAYYAALDEHSNNKVRVNAVLPMLDEFYETYAVSTKDAMYVAPENRIHIW